MIARATILVSPSLKLKLPECSLGVGDLITSLQSPKMIHGVKTAMVPLWPDDRGYFMEVLRVGQGLAAGFDPATTQVSSALSYPEGPLRRSTFISIRLTAGSLRWGCSRVSS